ncbi:MAG: ATP phosphoribosyltransferase [Coriobacteriia bacterium]|nr:ATP phosphoribosyltransferase [Coriobacteriia bacterium]
MELRAPRGLRDFLPAEASRREQLTYTIGQLFDRAGYGLIETPVLEGLDVIETGLHSCADDAFRFCDIDGRLVALRSDLTVPVARMVATRFTDIPVPYRLRYCADIFTEQEQLRGHSRHKTQLGVELIGEEDIEADAEIIRLAIDALRAVDLECFEVHANGDPAQMNALLALIDEEPYRTHIIADETIERAQGYYSGVVFDLFAPGVGSALGGGGRYDHVLADFGRDLPAVGFALDLALVIEALDAQQKKGQDHGKLRIAIPKGTLFADSVTALSNAGLDTSALEKTGRQLVFETDEVIYVIAKPTDVALYVASGVVDCGIGGRDIFMEADFDVLQLADLGYGACKFVVATPADDTRTLAQRALDQGVVRVATTYPRITQRFFDERGIQIELVKLNGNVEIAPLVGIADVIVDIVSTGTTLKENNLVALEDIATSSSWFVANPASARLDPRIFALADQLHP